MQSWPAVRLIRAVTRVEGSKMKSCVCPVCMVVTKPQPVWNRTLMICVWFASLRRCLPPQQSRYSRILSLCVRAYRGYRVTYIQEISVWLCVLAHLQMDCSHVFHLQCTRRVLENRWLGPRITFGFMSCPICKVNKLVWTHFELKVRLSELSQYNQNHTVAYCDYLIVKIAF